MSCKRRVAEERFRVQHVINVKLMDYQTRCTVLSSDGQTVIGAGPSPKAPWFLTRGIGASSGLHEVMLPVNDDIERPSELQDVRPQCLPKPTECHDGTTRQANTTQASSKGTHTKSEERMEGIQRGEEITQHELEWRAGLPEQGPRQSAQEKLQKADSNLTSTIESQTRTQSSSKGSQ